MPSVKAKNYGSGPHGYLQRVLMDGVKPFSHQSQTSRLLGGQGISTVQPLSASKVSSLTFNYQNPSDILSTINQQPQMTTIDNRKQAIVTNKNYEPDYNTSVKSSTLEIDVEHISQPDQVLSDNNSRSEYRANKIHKTEEMTVMSWLEGMQARQAVIQDELPQKMELEQSNSLINSGDPLIEQQVSIIPEKNVETSAESSAIQSLSIQPPSKLAKEKLLITENSPVSKKVMVPSEKITNLNLSDDQQVSLVNHLEKADPAEKIKNHPSLQKQGTTEQPVKIVKSQLTAQGKKHEQALKNKVFVQNDSAFNKVYSAPISEQSKQLPPESLPVTRPKAVLQGISISKLQQALQTRLNSVTSIPVKQSYSEQKEDSVKSEKQKIESQIHQHITILSSGVTANQSIAFWERNYMERSGPRSY